MQLRSFAFKNNEPLPPRYVGRYASNPPLDILDVPAQATSLALVVHDPDAVHGDFTHWVVWNISPNTTEILEGSAPKGASVGPNSAGAPGYYGPTPPPGSGRHHYTFDLFAISGQLESPLTADLQKTFGTIQALQISHAQLVGVVDA